MKYSITIIALLLSFAALVGCQCTSKSTNQTVYQTPLEVVIHYYKQDKFNGSILVAQNDQVLVDTVFGYQNFDKKAKLTKQTPFYIASLSKPITAVAISILEQKEMLSFEDNASKFLDSLPAFAKNITIKQLLNHTSGVKDYENIITKKGLTNKEVTNWLHSQSGLAFEPETKFQYSNTGYIILALVIEKVSKQSYAQFLKNNIFDPLQMQHTIVYESSTVIPSRAIGYNKRKKLDDYAILTTGDGGIYSTVEDLYKLDKALRANQLLSERGKQLLYKTPTLKDGTVSKYGLGWFVEKSIGGMHVEHTGGLAGFRAIFWRDLKQGYTIIALTNQGDAFPVYDFLNDMKTTLK